MRVGLRGLSGVLASPLAGCEALERELKSAQDEQ
jgi:hypothetical protein